MPENPPEVSGITCSAFLLLMTLPVLLLAGGALAVLVWR
jgi:hypothetical protein